MKHSSRASLLDPDQIAQAVRSSIEAFLHAMPNVVAPEFASRIEKLAGNVALWGSKMNLTAHPDDPEEIAFHVIDSLMPIILSIDTSSMLAGKFAEGKKILDVGSGAGFPGLVLGAASLADFRLVESRRKRASFLQVAVADMGLKNVMIQTKRAEEIGLAGDYDLVTARAFGNANDFIALAAKALKPGGLAMLYASPSQRVGDCDRIEYSVPRKGVKVERILALWRKSLERQADRQIVNSPRARN